MPGQQLLLTIPFIIALWAVTTLYRRTSRHDPSLPPGPPTIPFLGNIPIMPKTQLVFLPFTTWAREYGEIFSLITGPGRTMVVLTSIDAIVEVLDKKSAITSDRPRKMVAKLLTNNMMTGISPYNQYWRSSRRAIQGITTPEGCRKLLPIQVAEANQLMFDVMQSPLDIYDHICRSFLSTMFSVVFGHRTPRFTSHLIRTAFHIHHRISFIMDPGTAPLLDLFPFLQYLPERWVNWKKVIRETRTDQRNLYFGLLDDVEQRMRAGTPNGCHMETVFAMADDLKMTHEQLCYFGASMVNSGVSTGTAYFHFLVLVLTAYPLVRLKAQAEIDTLIGCDRAPVFQDIESLPYVQAVMKEVHRFRPIGPFLVPHRAMEDVMYKNYRIPAGSTIIPNVWGIFRDEKLFDNPDEFDPERYIRSPFGVRNGVDSDKEAIQCLNSLQFGVGRRACPGQSLTHQASSINLMNLLWGFDFVKAKRDDGSDIEPDLWAFNRGVSIDPMPFVINARLRSPTHGAIIKKNFIASSEVFQQFEMELDEEDLNYVKETRQ